MNHNLMPVAYAVATDPFTKSPLNPRNMSRTAAKRTTGHAPSTRILARVREAADDLALLATTSHGWKFVTEKNRAMVYEMTGRALPSGVSTTRTFGANGGGHAADFYLVRAVTTVHASVATVLDALATRTTDEFVPAMSRVFGKHFARGVVVDALSCTTPPPFAPVDSTAETTTTQRRQSFSDDDAYSVAWLALHGPSTGLSGVAKARDFTMVCYQDGYERMGDGSTNRIGRGALFDRNASNNCSNNSNCNNNNSCNCKTKQLLGVHVLSSVNFQDIPALPASQHTAREHWRNAGVVVETTNDRDTVRVSLFVSLLPTKSSLKHARKFHKWLQQLAVCVSNVVPPNVGIDISLADLGCTAWKHSDHCAVCLKMFRTFRRCHHCRLCGEAVCSACSGFVTVSTGGSRPRSDSDALTRSVASASGSSANSRDAFRTETRSCSVCLERVGSGIGGGPSRSMLLRRTSSLSASSLSDSRVATTSRLESTSHRSDDLGTSVISYGDDSDRPSSVVGTSAVSTGSSLSNAPLLQQQTSYYSAPLLKTDSCNSSHVRADAPSMSTTSSSFSRASHETDSHYAVGTVGTAGTSAVADPTTRCFAPSFSSEVSDGSGDLSMNPAILALAGLTLKPSQQPPPPSVPSVAEDGVVSDDGAAAAACSTGVVGAGGFGWSGHAPNVGPMATAGPRHETSGATFHFSVMANASAAPPKSSVHAEIAALMLQDLAATSNAASGPSGPYGRPPTAATALGASMRSTQPNYTTPYSFNPNASSHSVRSSSNSNSNSNNSSSAVGQPFASSKTISAAALSASSHHQQQRLHVAPSGPSNDMILLSALAPPSPEFVVFDAAQRESIFVRPGDGRDMIPLDLGSKF